MSQADELLNSLSTADISTYSANSEEEPHIVISDDRIISVPETLKRIAVQYDHNVETVTFDCPRYWDGLDMSTMKVYINYMLENRLMGSYVADNVTVDKTDSNVMHFSWTISRNVTAYDGKITFLVCIKKVDADGNEENHWNSELNNELYVSKGLETNEIIEEEYPDIITQLLVRMEHIIESESATLDTSLTESGLAADAGAVGAAIEKTNENIQANKTSIEGLDMRVQSTETTISNKFYVDKYITETTTDIAAAINQCIKDAINANGEVVFTCGKVYKINSPIVASNEKSTSNPIQINFNNATITGPTSGDPIGGLLSITACSNNGTVINHMDNLILDASNAHYGIYLSKSIRMRMNNISIKNGLQMAIRITGGIETYINNFSLWRTESANATIMNSYGINCAATDSYFSNGVIVNYQTACKGAGANYFTNIHPWCYFTEEEVSNETMMKSSVAFILTGQSVLNACEFDSYNVCVEQSGDATYKVPITMTDCMVVVSPTYESISGITNPTLIKLENGNGGNISVSNLNTPQTGKMDICFCNNENNDIVYDFSAENMTNLPKKDHEDIVSVGDTSGDCITVNTDHVEVANTPSMIFIHKDNLMPTDKLIEGEKTSGGVTMTTDSDMTVHFNGTAASQASFWLSGKWGGTDAQMILKANTRYCIMLPRIPETVVSTEKTVKVSMNLYNGISSSSTAVSVYTNESVSYVAYTPTEDTKITGIAISIPAGAVINDVTYKPAIYMGEKPKRYSQPSGSVVTDYTNGINLNGISTLVSLEEMTIKCGVKYSDYKNLLDRVSALETSANAT